MACITPARNPTGDNSAGTGLSLGPRFYRPRPGETGPENYYFIEFRILDVRLQ